jgi:DNA-binding response OmpR family regulator
VAHILVVEDEPDIALGLQLDLRDEGHEVEIATNGEEASRRGRESQWDVILLDVMLPLRDGFEVCRDLRRAKVRTPILMLTAKAQDAEKIGECEVDFGRAEVRRGGCASDLTSIELKMLEVFLRQPGRVVTRAQIIGEVWGDVFVTDRVVDTHVVKLRRMIEADPAQPRHIVSVRGIGYRFEP